MDGEKAETAFSCICLINGDVSTRSTALILGQKACIFLNVCLSSEGDEKNDSKGSSGRVYTLPEGRQPARCLFQGLARRAGRLLVGSGLATG
jgi:hypothetical protein